MNFAEIKYPENTTDKDTGLDMRDLMVPVILPVNLDEICLEKMRHYAFRAVLMLRCSACGRYIDPKKAKHIEVANPNYPKFYYGPSCGCKPPRESQTRDAVICECGATCIVTRIQKNTNYNRFYDTAKVTILNQYNGWIMLQKFLISRNIDPETKLEKMFAEEFIRYILVGDKVVHISKDHWWDGKHYFSKHGAEMTAGIDESFDETTDLVVSGIRDYPSLRYTQIGEYLKSDAAVYDRETSPLIAFERICFAAAHPWVEFVWKVGLHKLYGSIVQGKADLTQVRPQIIKSNVKTLLAFNAGPNGFYALRHLQRHKVKILDPEFYGKFDKYVGNAKTFLRQFKTEIEIKYLYSQIKRGLSVQEVDSCWYDYHSMLKTLNGEAEVPEYLLYPKNLKEAHDETARRINDLKFAKENAKWKKVVSRLIKFEYINAEFGLEIIAPRKATDLTFEGSKLGHCVGGYIGRVLDGSTSILFLRKLECPEEPLGTVEFNNGQLIQCRGFQNKDDNLPPNYKDFLENWQKHLKKQSQANT